LSSETPRWVLLARILRARGNKGEVAAEILTDFPIGYSMREFLSDLLKVRASHDVWPSKPAG